MAGVARESIKNGAFRLPSWLRQDVPDARRIRGLKQRFSDLKLSTVCQSARCPNMGECWSQGVATFMILGEICTRACRFCAVKAGAPKAVDPDEPMAVAAAVKDLNARYVVITSVCRDDLDDEGLGQFQETVRALRRVTPQTKVEVLVPDFSNRLDLLRGLADAGPDVISHNMETVRRLAPSIRPQADHQRSLDVLANFKGLVRSGIIKSGFMVGLGETDEEVFDVMKEIATTGCDILTIGQYLAPTVFKRHFRVQRFVRPEQFEAYKRQGAALGFKHIASAPLVRSSFIAERGYHECLAAIEI